MISKSGHDRGSSGRPSCSWGGRQFSARADLQRFGVQCGGNSQVMGRHRSTNSSPPAQIPRIVKPPTSSSTGAGRRHMSADREVSEPEKPAPERFAGRGRVTATPQDAPPQGAQGPPGERIAFPEQGTVWPSPRPEAQPNGRHGPPQAAGGQHGGGQGMTVGRGRPDPPLAGRSQ